MTNKLVHVHGLYEADLGRQHNAHNYLNECEWYKESASTQISSITATHLNVQREFALQKRPVNTKAVRLHSTAGT